MTGDALLNGLVAMILSKNITILSSIPRTLKNKQMEELSNVIKETVPYFVNTPAANPK